MVQTETQSSWQRHYSVLTQVDRDDPIKAILFVTRNLDFQTTRDNLMQVYATAVLDQVKSKYCNLGNSHIFFGSAFTCWLISGKIAISILAGKLTFLMKGAVSPGRLHIGESPKNAVFKKSGSTNNPIDALLHECTVKNLFGVREEMWQVFTDVISAKGDKPDQRRDWMVLFKQSIRLWELCFLLSELILNRIIDYSYHEN